MAEEIKKFYRSRTDRVLFGVCGGLGKYFHVDPVLFRLFFVLLLFVEGSGVLLYFIMVLVTPEEPGRTENAEKGALGEEMNELAQRVDEKAKEIGKDVRMDEESLRDSRNILGVVVVLVGLFFLARQILPLAWLDMDIIWAMGIVAIGFYIIFKR